MRTERDIVATRYGAKSSFRRVKHRKNGTATSTAMEVTAANLEYVQAMYDKAANIGDVIVKTIHNQYKRYTAADFIKSYTWA